MVKTLLRTGLALCTVSALVLTSGCKHRSYDNRGNLERGNVEAARAVPAEAPTQGSVPLPESPKISGLDQPKSGAIGGGPASPYEPAPATATTNRPLE